MSINPFKILDSLKLFKRAFYKHKRKLLLISLLGFFGGMVGGIGVGAIIPLFSLMVDSGPLSNDVITNYIRWVFDFIGIQLRLPYLLVFIAVLFIAKAVFLYIANYVSALVTTEYEEETRRDLFSKFLNSEWPYLMEQKVGRLSTVLIDDISVSASILTALSTVILSLTTIITYAIIAVNISATATFATIGIGAVVFLSLKKFFYQIRKLSEKMMEGTKAVSHLINQYIVGAKTIKSMAAENHFFLKGDYYFRELRSKKLKVAGYNTVLGTFLEPMTLLVIFPAFLMSYKNPDFNIASFAAILYLIQKMFSYMQSAQVRINIINEGMPRLRSVLEQAELAASNRERLEGKKYFSFKSNIEFKNVSFKYNDTTAILKDISFRISRGGVMGLIGSSGSGKTTIADLMLRLFYPTAGSILIDGENVNLVNIMSWRTNIGYVSQDIFLMNDSIADNIKFYNDNISDLKMEESAKQANIYDFIMELPDKFNTIVGERGIHLSVGQRQRIVLARVLAKDPEVLILDEATSSLDNESEVLIQRALEALRGKITIFIIAHRLTTVMNADNILVLGDGAIIEEGSPDKLLADPKSYFYRMHNAQQK